VILNTLHFHHMEFNSGVMVSSNRQHIKIIIDGDTSIDQFLHSSF